MLLSDEANNIQLYQSIDELIKLRPGEHEIRQRLLGFPQFHRILELRNRARLNNIEVDRTAGLQKLRSLTNTITTPQVDILIRSGIVANLLTLAGFLWRQSQTELEAVRVVIGMMSVASDEQVHQLVSLGCIVTLRKGLEYTHPPPGLFLAVKRIIEAGQAAAEKLGRNTYADQFDGTNSLKHLKQLRANAIEEGSGQHEILESILQLFEAHKAARPLATILNDQSELGQGWTLLHPFFKERRFPKWSVENSAATYRESSCPLKIKLFISHRWESLDEPDDSGKQFRSLVEYLCRVYMIANGYMKADDSLAQQFQTGAELSSQFYNLNVELCSCGTYTYVDVRNILCDEDPFYARVTDIYARRYFYQLLRHVHVWYDYTSMPQTPRTTDEQVLFEYRLNQLADIATQSGVVILWGEESLNRAWCVLEGIIGNPLHFCSTPTYEMREVMADKLAYDRDFASIPPVAKEMEGFGGRNSKNVSLAVQQIRQDIQGKSESAILEYLGKMNITCTHAEDVAIVARLMHRFVQSNDDD